MKKLSWVDKIIFVVNSLFATVLLLSYLVSFIPPSKSPEFSIISLGVPILIIINILFVIYWLIKLKRQFLLSSIVLLIGFQQVNAFFQLAEKKILLTDDLKIMSYNVRLFNLHKWKKLNSIHMTEDISKFIETKDLDVLCFQEYLTVVSEESFNFPYNYIHKNDNLKNPYFGQAIFSKYKIINSGSLNFDKSINNAIFADIVRKKDTIRIYNIHLESQRIAIDKENFGQEDSEKLRRRIQNTFKKQENQAKQLIAHELNCNYKVIMCGDFNNTAFSWVYKKIKGDKQDAFIEAGKNFGKSFDYPFPLRIDFILVDQAFTINNFKTHSEDFSDHFPISVRVNTTK